jgi:catechol 2,3-dioxygenase
MADTNTADTAAEMGTSAIPAETRIGHVHLKVADLDRAVQFYREVMGFDLLFNMGTAAFLSAGGYHHHLGLNTWESLGGEPAPRGTTGLYHFAINYPTRRDLAAALKRLLDYGWSIDGAQDHTTHEAIYLHDPDFNGIELACDRDPSCWSLMRNPTPDAMRTMNKPIDFDSLMGELGDPEATGAAKYLPTLRTFK